MDCWGTTLPSTYCMMYDTADGIVYEDYMIVKTNGYWADVMLSQVTFAEDCECEEDCCDHRVTCNEIGASHPALPGRAAIGQMFRARHISDLVEDWGARFKCIKIHYGQGIVGVATRKVE